MTAPQEPLPSDSTSALPRRRFGTSRGDDGGRPTYLSTEFLVFVVLVLGILLTSVIIQDTDDHEDYFQADRAWWYVTLLGIAYIVSRGLSKIGRFRDGSF